MMMENMKDHATAGWTAPQKDRRSAVTTESSWVPPMDCRMALMTDCRMALMWAWMKVEKLAQLKAFWKAEKKDKMIGLHLDAMMAIQWADWMDYTMDVSKGQKNVLMVVARLDSEKENSLVAATVGQMG